MDISFIRAGIDNFTMHRVSRDGSGLETAQDYQVLPGTPLHQWILKQEWPVSPQGWEVKLEVREYTPVPEEWLKFYGKTHSKHHGAHDLAGLYMSAGFQQPEVIAYGQTYDIAVKAGLLEQLAEYQTQMAAAEAVVGFTLQQGSGPWLFLVAVK